MKKLITFIITLSISLNSLGQTSVSGNQSGTWTAANSPYQVTGEIIVPNGQTLNIESGVEVNFQGYYKFTVNGLLNAIGVKNDSIRFTTNNPAIGWGGIRLDHTSGVNNLSYCRIEYGKTAATDYPDIHGGAIALIQSDITASHSVFADNEATGDDNGMGGAIYGINTTATSFTDCVFLRNHAYGEGGAIKLSFDTNIQLTNCQFIQNNCLYGGGAISFYSAVGSKMTTCLFAGNYTSYSDGGAIHTLGTGNNLFFENCTLYDNTANGGDGGGINIVYGNIHLTNCIVQNNNGAYSDNINIGMDGAAQIDYSNTPIPDDATGSNNINVNAQFVDSSNLDFHLLSTSPCIDTGTDIGLPFIGSNPDMGCFEYNPTAGLNAFEMNLIRIFPNPSKGVFRIQSKSSLQSIQITNLLGQHVFYKSLENTTEILDISSLNKGTYLAKIITKNGKVGVSKIIIQ